MKSTKETVERETKSRRKRGEGDKKTYGKEQQRKRKERGASKVGTDNKAVESRKSRLQYKKHEARLPTKQPAQSAKKQVNGKDATGTAHAKRTKKEEEKGSRTAQAAA